MKLFSKIVFQFLLLSTPLLNFILMAQDKTIIIDAYKNESAVDLLIGTNAGPMGLQDYSLDYTSLFKDLGIKAIRTQGYYGPCDWWYIFRTWSNDVNNPKSYNFAGTDSVIKKIIDGGFEVLFRLGTSWKQEGTNINDPPGTIRNSNGVIIHQADSNDFKKFAEICKRIVMHYNDGWANGFNYNIKKWEIWNEPSYTEQFWNGTNLQFIQMFSFVSKALKSYNPSLVIGGPGQESNVSEAFERDLINDCKTKNTPLDFYSFHSYGGTREYSTPYDVVRKATNSRLLLNNNGYLTAKLYCTEFNSEINKDNYANSGRGAAFYASAFIYLALNGVTELYQYRADNHPLGMTLEGGSLKQAAESMRAWKRLTEFPIRISTAGVDTFGFTSMATKTMDGKIIRVICSNFPSKSTAVKLIINNLPSYNAKWILSRRTIDNTKKLSLSDSLEIISTENSLQYNFLMQSESVDFIELSINASLGLKNKQPELKGFCLNQNYPNPFNPSTIISYTVETVESVSVKLYLFDMLGREVKTLVDKKQNAGSYSVEWRPEKLPSGVYYYQLHAGKYSQVRKMVYFK